MDVVMYSMDKKFKDLLQLYRKRLEDKIGKHSASKTAIARKAEVTPTYIMQLEAGTTPPPRRALCEELAKIFELSEAEKEGFIDTAMEERLSGDELQWFTNRAKIQRVPLISWVNANHFGETVDIKHIGVSEESVAYTGNYQNCFALVVKKDCMEPAFMEGDIIIVNPNLEPNMGDFIIVKDKEKDQATFKQYKRYGRKVILHPLNPKYNDIELDQNSRFEIVGVVVEKVKKYR